MVTVNILIVVCAILCGCGNSFNAPLGEVIVPAQLDNPDIRIYVCGAVEREGYYEVKAGTDYMDVLRLAGLLPESVIPTLNSFYVDGDIEIITVGYYDGEKICDSINVNSILIISRLSVDGLSESVVNKLADYIKMHGKIANKKELEKALGSDYADNHYKLFIAEKDYEETN